MSRPRRLFLPALLLATATGAGFLGWYLRGSNSVQEPATVETGSDGTADAASGVHSPIPDEVQASVPPQAAAQPNAKPIRFPSLPNPTIPVAELVTRLQPRAEKGDTGAALELFQALNWCRGLLRGNPVPDGGFLASIPEDVRETILKGKERQLELCASVPLVDTDEAFHWVDMAAAQGDLHAQYLYAALGLDVVGGIVRAARDEEPLFEYKARARGYLHNLVRECSEDAAYRLSQAYQGKGVLYKPDDFSAYVYLRFSQLAGGGTTYSQSGLSHLGEQLGAEAARAESQARDLHRRYCRDLM